MSVPRCSRETASAAASAPGRGWRSRRRTPARGPARGGARDVHTTGLVRDRGRGPAPRTAAGAKSSPVRVYSTSRSGAAGSPTRSATSAPTCPGSAHADRSRSSCCMPRSNAWRSAKNSRSMPERSRPPNGTTSDASASALSTCADVASIPMPPDAQRESGGTSASSMPSRRTSTRLYDGGRADQAVDVEEVVAHDGDERAERERRHADDRRDVEPVVPPDVGIEEREGARHDERHHGDVRAVEQPLHATPPDRSGETVVPRRDRQAAAHEERRRTSP